MAKRHQNQEGNLESMFLRMEELVLANSGEDEFEEVFKLLIAKLWDEYSAQSKFYVHKSAESTAEAVTELLREAQQAWSGILDEAKPRLTKEHLSICVDALAKHNILNGSLEVIDNFFEFIVAKTAKGAKGQYFTPRYVIELCVRMLRPQSTETTLDPACGSGGFLLHTLRFIHNKEGLDIDSLKLFCKDKLWGFDIDSRAIRVAKTLMLVAGDGSTNLIRLNSLLKPSTIDLFNKRDEPTLTIEDVCRSRMRRHRGFDLILTNPPFAGEVREKELLDSYSVSTGKKNIERDVLFIERCVDLLRPGGRLAIVLPHNKFGGKSFATLREWIFRKARILAVIGLARNTFLPHTHQKASVLLLQKHDEFSRISADYNIFFAISEKDGKNSKGQFIFRDSSLYGSDLWNKIDHDFAEILDSFEQFLKDENIHFHN